MLPYSEIAVYGVGNEKKKIHCNIKSFFKTKNQTILSTAVAQNPAIASMFSVWFPYKITVSETQHKSEPKPLNQQSLLWKLVDITVVRRLQPPTQAAFQCLSHTRTHKLSLITPHRFCSTLGQSCCFFLSLLPVGVCWLRGNSQGAAKVGCSCESLGPRRCQCCGSC